MMSLFHYGVLSISNMSAAPLFLFQIVSLFQVLASPLSDTVDLWFFV